jgi:hypothetical protein
MGIKAAGGTHDDYTEHDKTMVEERRPVMLVNPDRIIGNAQHRLIQTTTRGPERGASPSTRRGSLWTDGAHIGAALAAVDEREIRQCRAIGCFAWSGC